MATATVAISDCISAATISSDLVDTKADTRLHRRRESTPCTHVVGYITALRRGSCSFSRAGVHVPVYVRRLRNHVIHSLHLNSHHHTHSGPLQSTLESSFEGYCFTNAYDHTTSVKAGVHRHTLFTLPHRVALATRLSALHGNRLRDFEGRRTFFLVYS